MKTIAILIHKLNAPRALCELAFGPNHSVYHRLAAGSVIMATGVCIAKAPGAIDIHLVTLHYVADAVGYAIHGIGLTPFLDHIIKSFEKKAEELDARTVETAIHVVDEAEDLAFPILEELEHFV
jgi:type II secretory pathway predicted ATPase ExeA